MHLVFATQNKNKIFEIQKLVPDGISVKGIAEIGFTKDLLETSNTLKGNALQKVHQVYLEVNHNCFADDTGLEIEALNNEPGVYSARYAGEPPNANNNIDLVLEKMDGVSNRSARFRTIIASIVNGEEKTFEGIVDGEIISEKRGTNGFGYDPIFIPNGSVLTFAEMSIEEKNKFSHRSKAIQKFINYLSTLKPVEHRPEHPM